MRFHKLVVLILLGSCFTYADREREEKIRKLERACQQAHTEYFAPMRKKHTRECIGKGKDEGWCKRFYSDYGDDIYVYDLPECLEEFEFRNNKGS